MRIITTTILCSLILFACSKKKGGDDPQPVHELRADPNVKYLDASAGAKDSFIVHATMNWTLSVTNATWIQASATSGSSGATKVYITALGHNLGTTLRSATITLAPVNNTAVSPATVTIIQSSKVPGLLTSISTMTITGIATDKDSFLVQSNIDWSVSSSVAWLTPAGLTGSNNAKVYLTNNDDNLTGTERTATVTVAPVGTSLVAAATIGITQKPWYRPHGGNWVDIINASAQTPDGGFIFAGETTSDAGDFSTWHGSTDVWLLKTDATGRKIWQKPFGGDLDDVARSVAVAADGGYVAAGYTESINEDITVNYGREDIWLIKTDANGNKTWQKTVGGDGWDRAHAIIATTDGGFLVTGTTSSGDGDFAGRNGKDLFMLKVDGAGTKQWIKFFGGENSETPHGLIATADGGYVVSGYTSSSGGDVTGNPSAKTGAWVIKTDGSGNLVWQKYYTEQELVFGYRVAAAGDGGYIICGAVVNAALTPDGMQNDWDVIIIKLNGDGSFAWKKIFGGANTESATSIIPAQSGGFIFTGYTWSNDGDVSGHSGRQDIWAVKVDAAGNKVWQKTIGGTSDDNATSVLHLQNNTYLISGSTQSGKFNISGVDFPLDGVLIKIKDP